jgi:transcriptional regulator GlxA family with amidase domain
MRNLHEDLSINTLARRACMSASHFNRAFKSVFGSAPVEFVETLRISDAQTFRRAFERRLGTKPRSYLKNFNASSMAVSVNGEAALPQLGRMAGAQEPVAVPTQH